MEFSYTYETDEQLQSNANSVKEALLRQLASDGIIEDAEQLCASYVIGIHRKGKFGKIWDKVRGFTDDRPNYIVFKTPWANKNKNPQKDK